LRIAPKGEQSKEESCTAQISALIAKQQGITFRLCNVKTSKEKK